MYGDLALLNDDLNARGLFRVSRLPVTLGTTINTTSVENNANLSSDGRTLFFSSDRRGGFGDLDLYVSTRSKLKGQSLKSPTKAHRFKTTATDN